MGKSAADEKILSYNDVVLRRSDLEILSGPYYLNDRIIEFYFSFLSSTHASQDILLVPPSIAFWMTNCPDVGGLKDFVEPLKLPDKKLVIFPVNDNDDVSVAEGGSHWSLLAYYRSADVFVHHDSSRQMNKSNAMRLFKSVAGFMGDSSSACNAKYLECIDTPQQVNGYDCGLYVTATARTICCWHESSQNKDVTDLWFSAVKEQVTPSVVSEMRKEILGLIKDLMAKE
ncbi:Peptidase C48, SUMO/Sentrin/Ubl1 [Corchorus olitorius]|uniref:Peptidase C48, SUMO/Sentrin/Ubl1 n=1 Tax=Corchorus olitorius TaxID=93759 RepID=A0A1R3I3W4_9ROSI|nr:Peptidase C48, SUMO/Sentrin/Ubl1 [Corchorus olitorius]